jgi:hypothetical protein
MPHSRAQWILAATIICVVAVTIVVLAGHPDTAKIIGGVWAGTCALLGLGKPPREE